MPKFSNPTLKGLYSTVPSEENLSLPTDSAGLNYVIPFSFADEGSHYFKWKMGSTTVFSFTSDAFEGAALSTSFTIFGSTTIGGSLNVNGEVTFSSTATFLQDITFTGAVTFGGGLTVSSGTAVFDNGVTFNADFNHTSGFANFDSVIRAQNNVVIGTTAAGDDAVKVLALHNSATPPTTTVDLVQLYGVDLSAGNATLGLVTERAVAADAALVSTHSLTIKINGTNYRLLLAT